VSEKKLISQRNMNRIYRVGKHLWHRAGELGTTFVDKNEETEEEKKKERKRVF